MADLQRSGPEGGGPAGPRAGDRDRTRARRPNPLAELALPGSAVGRELRYPIISAIVLSVVAVVICYLLVGTAFAIIGGGLVVANFSYRLDPGRPAAMVAFLFALGAALATVLEQQPKTGDPTLLFATSRPGASTAGNMAGALLTVAAIMFGLTERVDGSGTVMSIAGPLHWLRRRLARIDLSWLVGVLLPTASCALIAVGLRAAVGIGPTSAEGEGLVENVRMGVGYASQAWLPASRTAAFAPLGILTAAFSPLGVRFTFLATGALVVVLAGLLATRLWGARAAAPAALVAALAPPVWDAPLSVTLAAGAVLAAVYVLCSPPGDPTAAPTDRSLALAGMWAGVAFLARPDTVVVAPVLVAWLVWGRGTPIRRTVRLALVAGAVAAPWVHYVWADFGFPFLTQDLASLSADPGVAHRLPGLLTIVSEVGLVAGVVLLGPRNRRRHPVVVHWRRALPVAAVPALSAVLGLPRVLDRGLLSWAAPCVAVALAGTVRRVGPARAARPGRVPADQVTPGRG